MSAENPRITRLATQIEALQAEMARLATLPIEPKDETATVTFSVQFSGQGPVYTYAARKARGKWFTTGPQGGGTPRTWDSLVGWIDQSNVGGIEESALSVVTKVKAL